VVDDAHVRTLGAGSAVRVSPGEPVVGQMVRRSRQTYVGTAEPRRLRRLGLVAVLRGPHQARPRRCPSSGGWLLIDGEVLVAAVVAGVIRLAGVCRDGGFEIPGQLGECQKAS